MHCRSGGSRHADFSFLGPTINKAARLQALRKESFNPEEHPVRILIGDTTRSLLAEPELAVVFEVGEKVGFPFNVAFVDGWCSAMAR